MRVRVKQMIGNYQKLRVPAGAVIQRPNRMFLETFGPLLQARGHEVYEAIDDLALPAGVEFSSELKFPRNRVEVVRQEGERRSPRMVRQ